MKNNDINASLSVQSLTFRTGTSPVSFDVTVNNDSDSRATFYIDIKAAGGNRNQGEKWYKLEPEVAAAKPPGSTTNFQVIIFDTPITGFVGIANLTVRISSPELGQERRLLLRLNIESENQLNLLELQLPVKQFHVDASNIVDIPVQLHNLGQQSTKGNLSFIIDSRWLIGNSQQPFSLEAGCQTEVVFRCQAPSAAKAASKNYPFKVQAVCSNSYSTDVEGNIEILPFGSIEFDIPQPRQIIPTQRQWLPNWKSDTASFELHLKSISNLYQQINIKLQGKDAIKCSFKQIPEISTLDVGNTNQIILDITTKRHWVGIRKNLQLEAKPELSDQRLGFNTEPPTKSLELKVLPIIPFWLQLTILALIAAILSLISRANPVMHTDSVNSVDLNGIGTIALSGSNDCTLRRWEVRRQKLQPDKSIKYRKKPIVCGTTHRREGLLAIFGNDDNNQANIFKEVGAKVIRFIPKDNDIVAVGLDQGFIELRDVKSGEIVRVLKETSAEEKDQIFDLEFTPDSHFLFSGHGSGKVRFWSIESLGKSSDEKLGKTYEQQPIKVLDLREKLKLDQNLNQKNISRFLIRALKFIPTSNNQGFLVIAGNYSSFIILPWNPNNLNAEFKNILIQNLNTKGISGGETDYVSALATFNDSNKILATADSTGYITTWNLGECLNNFTPNPAQEQQISELNCARMIDNWQAAKLGGVNTLSFSEDGRLLISGGNDGRVMVWQLDDEYKYDKTQKGQKIYQSNGAIFSIDLETNNQGKLMVLIGGEDKQVTLRHIRIESK